MPTIDLAEVCQVVQQDLNNIAGQNAPILKPAQTGFLDAITSGVNTAGVEQIQTDTNDGKYRQVKVEYIKPTLKSEVSDTPSSTCSGGDEKLPEHDLVKVTRYKEIKRRFTEEEFRKFCKGAAHYKAQIMASDSNALFEAINDDLIALNLANVGTFYNGVAAGKDLPLLHETAEGEEKATAEGETFLIEDMNDLSVAGMPIVVGSNIVSRYATYQKIGTANDLGQDINKLKNWMFFRDKAVDVLSPPAANKSNMLVFAPGACQLISFNKYVGEFQHSSSFVEKRTLVNPVKDVTLDWNMKYDDCLEQYISVLSLNYDYWVMPQEAFDAADPRFGTNYTFQYLANKRLYVP